MPLCFASCRTKADSFTNVFPVLRLPRNGSSGREPSGKARSRVTGWLAARSTRSPYRCRQSSANRSGVRRVIPRRSIMTPLSCAAVDSRPVRHDDDPPAIAHSSSASSTENSACARWSRQCRRSRMWWSQFIRALATRIPCHGRRLRSLIDSAQGTPRNDRHRCRRRRRTREFRLQVSMVTRSESGTEAAERHESRARDRVTSQARPALWTSTDAAAR